MQRQLVVSSNLRSVGFQNGVLEIEFNSGSVYQYFNVPQSIYSALMAAGSHGKFFASNIKNVYQYSRIA